MSTPSNNAHAASPGSEDAWTPEALEALNGAVLDARWQLEEQLGSGGMGAVFAARQLSVGRRVAIKIIRPDLTLDAKLTARFLREGRLLSSLHHPNIVTLFDVGEDPHLGVLFLVMERLAGQPLDERLDTHAIQIEEVFAISEQLLSALSAVHNAGMIHRDIKPSNLILQPTSSGGVNLKLIDFGVARAETSMDLTLTGTGQIHGTPRYMAPEQIQGKTITTKIDLYAAGLVMYKLISGVDAFTGSTIFDIFVKQVQHPPTPLASLWTLDAPPLPRLIELVHTLLAKEAAQRPRSAQDALKTLRSIRKAFEESAPSLATQDTMTGSANISGRPSAPCKARATPKASRAIHPTPLGLPAQGDPPGLEMEGWEDDVAWSQRTPQTATAIALVLSGALIAGMIAWAIWPEPHPQTTPETATEARPKPHTSPRPRTPDPIKGEVITKTHAPTPPKAKDAPDAGEAPQARDDRDAAAEKPPPQETKSVVGDTTNPGTAPMSPDTAPGVGQRTRVVKPDRTIPKSNNPGKTPKKPSGSRLEEILKSMEEP